jgi:hypothetical protein
MPLLPKSQHSKPRAGWPPNPPYLHDQRLLTLDDTVEFFNLVLGTKLTAQEKQDLVAFMLSLQNLDLRRLCADRIMTLTPGTNKK